MLDLVDEIRSTQPVIIDTIRVFNRSGSFVGNRVIQNQSRPYLAMRRSKLDNLLLQNAKKAGAIVKEEMQVIGLSQLNKRWKITVRNRQSNDTKSFTSDFIVGADGRNSIFSLKTGKNQKKSKKSKTVIRVGVQWHVPFQPQFEQSLQMFLFEKGYFGIVNIDENLANVAMVTNRENAQLARKDFGRFLQATVFTNKQMADQFTDLTNTGEVHTTYPIDPRINQAQHERVYLIGDASHTVEPFTGEGVYFALQNGIKTAIEILNQLNIQNNFQIGTGRSRLTANRIYSPIVKRGWLSDQMIAVAAKIPQSMQLGLKPVFGRWVHFTVVINL
jgi:flavin-dependent dehydrogenase